MPVMKITLKHQRVHEDRQINFIKYPPQHCDAASVQLLPLLTATHMSHKVCCVRQNTVRGCSIDSLLNAPTEIQIRSR